TIGTSPSASPARSLLVRQQLEQLGEQRRDEARMRIHTVRVVDRAVPHREYAPPRAHGHGRLEVRPPDVLAVVAQPLRGLDEQLRAPLEQLGQRLRPVLAREPVLLLDRDPRQLAPLLLDALRVLLQLPLGDQQLLARRLPLLLRPDLHRTSFALTSSP